MLLLLFLFLLLLLSLYRCFNCVCLEWTSSVSIYSITVQSNNSLLVQTGLHWPITDIIHCHAYSPSIGSPTSPISQDPTRYADSRNDYNVCICYSECVKSGNVYISWNFQGIYTFPDSLRDCIYSLIFSGNLHIPWKIELIFWHIPWNCYFKQAR